MDKETGDNNQKKSVNSVNTAGQRFLCIFFHNGFEVSTASNKVFALANNNKVFALARIVSFTKHVY